MFYVSYRDSKIDKKRKFIGATLDFNEALTWCGRLRNIGYIPYLIKRGNISDDVV